jgi:hypothetical protein
MDEHLPMANDVMDSDPQAKWVKLLNEFEI